MTKSRDKITTVSEVKALHNADAFNEVKNSRRLIKYTNILRTIVKEYLASCENSSNTRFPLCNC